MNFPTTRWTLVGRAGGGDANSQPIAIAEMARMYAPAMRAHLLQLFRGDDHRADDLLQGFLADKVLEQRLIGFADPKRGRFRTFLLAALDRYVIDMQRRSTAQKRSPQTKLFDVDEQRDTLAAARQASPSDAFDLAWAKEVLGEVISTMRRHCEHMKRPDLWEVFEVRYLNPATQDVEPESHESIAKRLKLQNPQAAANLLITAKRMFTRVFKSVVSRYAADEQEVEQEFTELWQIFASKKG